MRREAYRNGSEERTAQHDRPMEGGLCSTPLQKYIEDAETMELLYRGFDGLDVSFKGQIAAQFAEALERAKADAQKFRSQAALEWNGICLSVFESGARGGYAYTATTGEFGATWFFKKPNTSDPWGVRVSCNSFFLALHGLGEARSRIYATMAALEVALAPNPESIGRVDYALDFLAPGFTLNPEHFVMHSNARRSDHIEPDPLTVDGRSGRVTSVTIGKMPGRQVIVYDKRAEVIAKGKVGWWVIWDAKRARMDAPPLIRDNPSACTIWRVEVRAGKKHLKDRWGITSWSDLDSRFGDMLAAALDTVRHTSPVGDSNRSRWPDSALWQAVRIHSDDDLFEMRNFANPDLIKRVQRDEHDKLLAHQMLGLLTSRAAILGIGSHRLANFAQGAGRQMAVKIEMESDRFAKKLAEAIGRYHVES